MSQLTTLGVAMIAADPNQPRKFFDESAMAELTESVRANGILQPILVRPNGPKLYLLVCGERRLRAAKGAGLTEIPAVIRELTDDEALEVQIVENLQRKDVNPMEEAVAFKSLAERFEVEEIAAKVGKSVSYVTQRLSLTNLLPDFQEILFAGKMALVDAYKLARTDVATQKEFAGEWIPKGWRQSPNYKFELGWKFRECQMDLLKAPFDINDALLYPSAGACMSCPSNSGFNKPLFPDLAHESVCSNPKCYALKVDKNFKKLVEQCAIDPDVLFVKNSYDRAEKADNARLAIVKNLGQPVVSVTYGDIIEAPDPIPSWEAFLKEREDQDDSELEEMTAKEKKEWLADVKEDWEREKSDYQEQIEKFNDPKLKKGLLVVGNKAGAFIKIKVKSSGKASSSPTKGSAGPSESESIDQEIEGIKNRERRSKELDGEKIVEAAIKMLESKEKEYLAMEMTNDNLEEAIFIYCICSECHDVKDYVAGKLGLKNYREAKLVEALVADKGKKVDYTTVIRLFTRFKVLRAVYLDPTQYGTALASSLLAAEFFKDEYASIVQAQAEKATKRGVSAENRIKALRKKKAELKPVALKKIKK